MRIGKRLLGFGLATLGAIGSVICLAGIAGVWYVAGRLQQVNSKVFSQADQLIAQVDQRAARAGEAVGGTRDVVDTLTQTLRDAAQDLLAERPASRPKIDNLEQRLASAWERADGLIQVSASTAELIEQVLATVDSLASKRNADPQDAAKLMAIISATRESLASARERLADLRRCLDAIRQKREVDVNLTHITQFCLGLVATLDSVQEQIAAFRGHLDEAKNRLGKLQTRLQTWVFAGHCLILLLIAWGGVGQYCLLVRGWRILRQPSSESGVVGGS